LGQAFEIDNYSDFNAETEIRHVPESYRLTQSVKCKFKAAPLSVAQSGVCPVCGDREAIPLLNAEDIGGYARDLYRAIVTDFTDWAMWQYVVDDWYSLRGINNGRLHVDHIYPVNVGYTEVIPEAVIGSPVNCRYMTAERNLRKRDKAGQSLEQLIGRYEQFVQAFPEWVAAREYYTETGTLSGAPKPKRRFQDEAVFREVRDEESQPMIDKVFTEAKNRGPRKRSEPWVITWPPDYEEQRQKRLRKKRGGSASSSDQ